MGGIDATGREPGGDSVDVAALVARLRSPDQGTRQTAARDLRALGPGALRPHAAALLLALDQESASAVRLELAGALTDEALPEVSLLEGCTRTATAVALIPKAFQRSLAERHEFQHLFEALQSPRRRDLADLLKGLARLDGPGTVRALKECVASPEGPVQCTGLSGLLEIPPRMAVEVLREFQERKVAESVRPAVQEASAVFDLRWKLGQLGLDYFPARRLGVGGMGAVYLCHRASEPLRRIAFKCVEASRPGGLDPDLLSRFRREAEVPRLLNHPNVIRVHAAGVAGSMRWIDEEFIHGETLEQVLEREMSVPWERALPIMVQLARALAHLHERGVVHRDVKPANVFLERFSARVVLGDFGLVAVLDSRLKGVVPGYVVTQAPTVMGSPGYMPLEQCLSSTVDHRADIYALGVVCYQLLEGWLPIPNPGLGPYVAALTSGRPPEEMQAPLPRGASDLIFRLLARSPQDRTQSAGEVAEAFEALGGLPVIQVEDRQPIQRGPEWRFATGTTRAAAGAPAARPPAGGVPAQDTGQNGAPAGLCQIAVAALGDGGEPEGPLEAAPSGPEARAGALARGRVIGLAVGLVVLLAIAAILLGR